MGFRLSLALTGDFAGFHAPRPPARAITPGPGRGSSVQDNGRVPDNATPATLPTGHPLHATTRESAIVQALRGRRPATGRPPVWFMRQAGRSLPEYKEVRAGGAMLDACLTPDLAAEITLQPVRRHKVDAAIFFSDIVIPLLLVGVDVRIEPGKGPVLGHPVRTEADVDALTATDPFSVGHDDVIAPVAEAVRRVVAGLPESSGRPDTPLIGFAGAPFTLACYLIEGGPSKDHLRTRAFMHAMPGAWERLLSWLADLTGSFLRAQVLAGASAAQLFDSWAGALSLEDYRRWVAPASTRALGHVADLTDEHGDPLPITHFGVNTGELLTEMRLPRLARPGGRHGVDCVGVDWRLPLDVAVERLGPDVTVQGNIDPAMLFAPEEILEAHVEGVLRQGSVARAHVLNLGHGVPPETDPDVLTRLVARVHG